MKFENFEVQEKYYEIHRKYGILHSIPADRNKIVTYDDLELLEEEFKRLSEIFSNENEW